MALAVVFCSYKAEGASRFELSLYDGKMSVRAGSTTIVDPNRTIVTNMPNGTAAGLNVWFGINSFLALGSQFGMHGANYQISLLDRSNTPDDSAREVSGKDNNPVGLLCEDLILRYQIGRIEPYIFGGIGWTLYIDDKSFSTDYGAGINIYLLKHLAVRGEFRKYHTTLNSAVSQLFTPSYSKWYRVDFPFSDRLDFKEIYVGLVYAR